MAGKESFRARQEAELEVIKSIYGPDVEDLRPKNSNWRPLDVRILLKPLQGSAGDGKAYATTKLHVSCPAKYPKFVPNIFLEDTKGLSDNLIQALLDILLKEANSLKGEVMIYNLAQAVQDFLHKHNKPPRGSFYDEMLEERQKREQEQLTIQRLKENLERQTLLDKVEKRKEMFQNEAKIRVARRSISESTTNRNRHPSSSDSSDNFPYYGSHMYPNKCVEHKNSEKLYFPKSGRQVQRGCCLGHSQKGCVAFSGIDIDTGQLLYVTQWTIKYTKLEMKCSSKCYWSEEVKCTGHKVDDFIASIEKHVSHLSQLSHKNLIQYECVLCLKRKDGVVIYLVQDFVLGTSVFSISNSLGWCAEGSKMVAKGVLEALACLHNAGVSHSYLFDSTVFMDNTGTIRCTDFSLVPNLLELIGVHKSNKGDLPALGSLIESLMPTPPYAMRQFIEKCNSDRTLSAFDLISHPFLHVEESKDLSDSAEGGTHIAVLQKRKLKRRVSDAMSIRKSTLDVPSFNGQGFYIPQSQLTASQTRIWGEFDFLSYLGRGAFGDVLKVRNKLDNREYAIKRIPLSSRNKLLYKKMTREVELLSRLNHENVVRYFNSWIENASQEHLEEMDSKGTSDWSGRDERKGLSPVPIESENTSASSYIMPNIDDDSSDGIAFLDSNGEVAQYEDEENIVSDTPCRTASPRLHKQIMYIQMEFCEKSTLRQAIDLNLYRETDRLWRLFREILEGLSHIHQQGIIHRDLKPVNIFLDSRDQIKIGDFGLATTSFLALQSQEPVMCIGDESTGTGTGKVGTTLYVAPELTGNASKSTYSQKVDMYTLGIILFEMSNPPFETGMERVKTIVELRNPSIIIPERMLIDPTYENTIEILRWLLNYDPSLRPTAENLLASDLMPPVAVEANELQEMMRHVLTNPQSKAYKHLVARCLQQDNGPVLEATYNMDIISKNSLDLILELEYLKGKVQNIFRKHGGIEINTPLLSPFSRKLHVSSNSPKLMTHSGCVVTLPTDLRVPFARYIAMFGMNMVRRYSIDRVYREKKMFYFHPKQYYECAFDIITPDPGNLVVDAELISIAFDILNEMPNLKEKVYIRINHTSLLRAILTFANVPKNKYNELFVNILDYYDNRLTKFQFQSSVSSILQESKSNVTLLIELIQANCLLGGPRINVDHSALKVLFRGKGEVASLAKGAIRELESTVSLAQSFGVGCPIRLYGALPISYNRASGGGIVWQMVVNIRQSNNRESVVILAFGERYDTMLSEFQQTVPTSYINIPNRSMSGAGCSVILDKLIAVAGSSNACSARSVDVGVCIFGSRSPLKDAVYTLRLLWSAGIRSCLIEASGLNDAHELARELAANHLILFGEGGTLRVRSSDLEKFQEKTVTMTELVDYIKKLLKLDTTPIECTTQTSITSNSASIKKNSLSNLPAVDVKFLTKVTGNMRRRQENIIIQNMSSTLVKFEKTEHIVVMVLDLSVSTINCIVGALNPRAHSKKETETEMKYIVERFPELRRNIVDTFDEILELITTQSQSVVALYSTPDSSYRLIL